MRFFLILALLGLYSIGSRAQPQKLIHFWDFNNTIPLTGIGDVGGNGDSLGNATHALPVQYTTLPLAGAKIVYYRPHAIQPLALGRDSVLDNDVGGGFNYDYSSVNYPYFSSSDSSAAALVCACSGNLCIRTRNPSLNAYVYMYVPTTGYMNVTLSYALSATSNKAAQYAIFSYSTNGGLSWNKLTSPMDTFNIGGHFYPDTLQALNPITAARLWYPIHIDFSSAGAVNNNNGFIVRFFMAGSNSLLLTGSNRYDNIAIQGDSVCPVLWKQPLNTSVCVGSNTYFVTKVAGGLTDTYQWQVNTGLGFNTIINGGVYSGATTDSLILTNVPIGMNGYKYRCIIHCPPCNNDTSTTAILTVNPLPVVMANASATSICAGNNVTLTGSGAVSYTWTGGATNGVPFIPASTQTYTVTGTGVNGCTDTASVTVTVNPTPTVTANASATVVCAGSSVTLTGGGAITYTWTGGVTDGVPFIPASTQTYTVTGTGPGGCKDSASITITVNPLPNVIANASATSICTGSSVTLTGGGAVSYVWTGGAINGVPFIPASTQTYTVTGKDANGCTNTASITVTVNPLPAVTAHTSADSVCVGSSITLTGGGAVSYTWTGGVTDGVSFAPASTQTYTVTGTDANGCTNTASITITVNPLPNVMANASATSVCAGGSVILTGGGAITYIWTGGATNGISFMPASTQTYTVTGTGANGCTDTASLTVTVVQIPVPTVSGKQTICEGASANLVASGGLSYSWLPSASLNSNDIPNPTASPSNTTIYTVTVANGNCTALDSVTVIVNPLPVEAASPNATIQITQSTPLSVAPQDPRYTYVWMPATGLSCTDCPNPVASPTITTTYYLVTTDTLGCKTTDTVKVNVIDDCGRLFIPNVFSPNGDGHNDILLVYGVCIEKMDFIIYDRWGNKVFESEEQALGWDGTYKGQRMNPDTYVYYLAVTLVDGTKLTKSGNVALVR